MHGLDTYRRLNEQACAPKPAQPAPAQPAPAQPQK